MDKYISADKLIEFIACKRNNIIFDSSIYSEAERAILTSVISLVGKFSPADVVEVKHGKWKKIQYYAKCSECMHEVNWGSKDFLSPYCPNCGARMDG